MELSWVEMYWLLKLDDIINFLTGTGVVGIGALVVFCIFAPITICEVWKNPPWAKIKIVITVLIIYIITAFLTVTFIPSTKQLAAIIVVPKIVNNEQVQEIPEKLLNLGLEWIDELKPDTENANSDN